MVLARIVETKTSNPKSVAFLMREVSQLGVSCQSLVRLMSILMESTSRSRTLDIPVYPGPGPVHLKISRIFALMGHLINMKRFWGFLVVLLCPLAWAQPTPHTKATLYLSEATAKPGSTVNAALHMKMEP